MLYIIIKLLFTRRMAENKKKCIVFDVRKLYHPLQGRYKNRLYLLDTFVLQELRKLRFILNRINNLTSIFHLAIIAVFLLSLNGCGYKKAPYYLEEAPKGDENIAFSLKQPSDANQTQTKE